MKNFLTAILGIFITINLASGQNFVDQFILENSKEISPTRYKGIKGSPYLFQNWVSGKIVNLDNEIFMVDEMNYNGYTQEIEIKQGNRYISLNENFYKRIEFNWNGETFNYQRVLDRERPNTFLQVLYKGKKLKLIKDFEIKLSERVVQDVGKKVEMKRFSAQHNYYLANFGELEEIKLKKKSIVKQLGKEVDAFSKQNKIDLSTESGLVKVLEFYETQTNE